VRAIVIILVVAFVVCFMAFVVYNSNHDQRVDVHKQPFASGTFHNVALAEIVFWSFLSGVLLTVLVFLLIYIRQSVQLHSVRRRVRALEGEVTILRNRPIEESADLLKGADLKASTTASPFEEDRKE
jgi:uncharacterized membrane protein YciS (DUF1049 family)